MKKLITAKLAGDLLLASLGLLLIFHLLVLLNFLPADMIWGGQANADNPALEIIAIVVTMFFGWIVAAKTGYVKAGKFAGALHVLVWIVFAFLLLNTLGNLASGVFVENFIFAPITLILALCALRLAVEK
ncbi:MAG: hypothetical protein L6Q26_01695 [Anaerolineales bacterium]|nr:hypothetical protein [Anaerolineales bacterium]NUQ83915.1 hypothetical protein [Anaerolineales bacterium]